MEAELQRERDESRRQRAQVTSISSVDCHPEQFSRCVFRSSGRLALLSAARRLGLNSQLRSHLLCPRDHQRGQYQNLSLNLNLSRNGNLNQNLSLSLSLNKNGNPNQVTTVLNKNN